MKTNTIFTAVLLACGTFGASAQNWSNAKEIASNGASKHNAVKIDQSGNTFAAGGFQNTIGFAPLSFTSTGNNNHAYLVKYDPSGSVVEALECVGSDCEIASMDISGQYVYVAGYYSGSTMSIGSSTLPAASGYDCFAAKVRTSDLSVVWVYAYGAAGDQVITSIATSGGMLGVTGIFYSALQIGSYSLTDATGNGDMFVAGLDTSGTPVFAHARGGNNRESGYSIVADSNGNWYVQGQFESSSLICNSATLSNYGTQNIFVMKFSPTGTEIWATSAGSTNYDYARGIAVSGSTVCILGMYNQGNIVFGQYGIADLGGCSYCVASYDIATGTNTGALSLAIGPGVSPTSGGIAGAQNGDMYLTGSFSGIQQIGPASYTAVGASDGFVARYVPSANTIVSACQTGGAGDESPTTVCAGASGTVTIIGSYAGTSTTFGSIALTNADAFADGFLATASLPLAILEQDWHAGVVLTQNFFSGSITVTLPENAECDIRLYDMAGREVKCVRAEGYAEIFCGDLAPGMYSVMVLGTTVRYTEKVIKQ